MTEPLRIQVVGPYIAPTIDETYRNIQAAHEIARKVILRGHYVFCPHTNTGLMGGLVSEDVFLKLALFELDHRDAIVLVPGWEGSKGSVAEHSRAQLLNLSIFHSINDVPERKW